MNKRLAFVTDELTLELNYGTYGNSESIDRVPAIIRCRQRHDSTTVLKANKALLSIALNGA